MTVSVVIRVSAVEDNGVAQTGNANGIGNPALPDGVPSVTPTKAPNGLSTTIRQNSLSTKSVVSSKSSTEISSTKPSVGTTTGATTAPSTAGPTTTTTSPTTTTTVVLKPVGNIEGIVLGPAETKVEKQNDAVVDAIENVDTGGAVVDLGSPGNQQSGDASNE